jgi:hypothetical protein
MIPAFRTLDKGSRAGVALPSVWRTLERRDVRFYRGELSMIAGPPGGGKSTMALQYAVQSKAPGLYVSCDMGEHMSSKKIGSILTGQPEVEVEKMSKEDLRGHIRAGAPHLWLAHEQRPSPEDLAELVHAYIEVQGTPPHQMVVDNVVNVASSGTESWNKLAATSEVLHWLAGRYEIGVLALAHVKLGAGSRPYPASMDQIKGQISDLPAVIITGAADPSRGKFRGCAVKNRHGLPDPTGQDYWELDFDAPTGRLSDKQWAPSRAWGYSTWDQERETA